MQQQQLPPCDRFLSSNTENSVFSAQAFSYSTTTTVTTHPSTRATNPSRWCKTKTDNQCFKPIRKALPQAPQQLFLSPLSWFCSCRWFYTYQVSSTLLCLYFSFILLGFFLKKNLVGWGSLGVTLFVIYFLNCLFVLKVFFFGLQIYSLWKRNLWVSVEVTVWLVELIIWGCVVKWWLV